MDKKYILVSYDERAMTMEVISGPGTENDMLESLKRYIIQRFTWENIASSKEEAKRMYEEAAKEDNFDLDDDILHVSGTNAIIRYDGYLELIQALELDAAEKQDNYTRYAIGCLPGLKEDTRKKLMAMEASGIITINPDPERPFTKDTLETTTARHIERCEAEYRNRKLLQKNGLSNMKRIILTGPAGTGKSAAAEYTACKLRLPLVTVKTWRRPDPGDTEAVYEIADTFPAVYLFDGAETPDILEGAGQVFKDSIVFFEKEDECTPFSDKALCMADDAWYFDKTKTKVLAAFLKSKFGTRLPDAEDCASKIGNGCNWTQIIRTYNAVLKGEFFAGREYNSKELERAFIHGLSVYKK